MSTQTKTLIAAYLVLAIAMGWQVNRLSRQQDRRLELMGKATEQETQIRQIQREQNRIRSLTESIQSAIMAVQFQNKYTTEKSELSEWLNRVNRLKQWLQKYPEKRIPEMRFLTSNDWLSVTLDSPLKNDAQIRDALSKLRQIAKMKPQIVDNLASALRAYSKANNGGYPSDPLQLQSYLNPALANDILQRYEPAPEVAGQNDANGVILDGLHLTGSGRVILQEKTPVDEDYDTWVGYMEKGGWATIGVSQIQKTVDQAARAFIKANNGQDASTPEQLLPYFSTEVDPVRLKEYWDVSRH